MSDEPRQIVADTKGVSLALWPALAVVLLLLAWGGVALHDDEEKTTVVAAKRALPAYHRIAERDLTTVEVEGDGPKGALKSETKLVGTVTRKALAKDAKLVKGDVTEAAVEPGALAGVRLRLHATRSTTVSVEPGDTVMLRLAPTSDGEALAPASIPALLIDSNGKQGAGGQQVVIVDRDRVEELLRLVGRADLMITPGSPRPPS